MTQPNTAPEAQARARAEAEKFAGDVSAAAYRHGFFARLREFNIHPTEKQAGQLLEMAEHLRATEKKAALVEAGAADDYLAGVNAQLAQLSGLPVGNVGPGRGVSPAQDAGLKLAARELAADPRFVEAVLLAHAPAAA